jgi:5-methylcytosine-specific restriction protein A
MRMNAYIYTWNPTKWKWIDLPYAVSIVNSGESFKGQWSCGNSRKPQAGDMFLLMKLGGDPSGIGKGVVGCGYILSAPERIEHWDEKQRMEGKSVLSTSIEFKALSDRPLISYDELSDRFRGIHWTPQQSGTSVPVDVAKAIFLELTGFNALAQDIVTSEISELFVEGDPKEITVRSYDRCSRAREACITHNGYSCAVCGFSFERVYGQLGAEYIEVHHLRPVAEVGGLHLINPTTDLKPVCSNCHRMLHRRRPALSIEELIACMNDV